MNTGLLVLGALVLFVLSRRSSAAVDSSPDVAPEAERASAMGVVAYTGSRADVVRGIELATTDMETDAERAASVTARWGELLRRYPRPLPPQLAAMVIARESGGSVSAAGDVVLGERGLWQLSNAECIAAGVANPLDAEASTRGAQLLYRQAIRSFPEPDVESQLLIALLSRSIGLGDTRRLRSLVDSLGVGGTFAQQVRAFVESAEGKPSVQLGRADVTTWARRVYRGCLRCEQAITLGWVAPDSNLLA